jgi:hypothetical protein
MVNNNIIEYTSDNPRKYAYAYINNEYIFFEQNDLNGSTTPNGLTISEEDGDLFVILNEEFTVYKCDCVSGKTSSKLINLINIENLAIDNLGNKLNGVLPIIERDGNNGKKIYVNNNNLKTNDWIFIPYTPNYVFDIEEISDNVYWGDFIKSITFNYLLNNDKKNIKCEDVNTLKNTENEIHENISNISNITCEIEYYIGTLLTKDDNKYVLLLNGDGKYYGIKYIDNISLTHEQCLYYYTDFESCIINYLKLTPTVETYTNQTYNVPNISEEISYFEFNIKPFDLQYGFVDYYNLQNSTSSFYKVNLLDEFIDLTIENNKIQSKFYIKGVNKCFSFILPSNLTLYETYSYYYQINDNKYYATYENGNYVIKIDDDNIYVSNNLSNDFNLKDDVKIPSPYNLYCEITIKLHLLQLSNTHDTYFEYNNMTLTPNIYNENKIGMATPEKISGDIYIDRGAVRSIDYHLRLLECKSLESLEQIGNGFFNIITNK